MIAGVGRSGQEETGHPHGALPRPEALRGPGSSDAGGAPARRQAATSRAACPLMIPVEIQVREMDAKILLAAVAAERGFPVVIGSRTFVHFQASHLPRGVYLAKSMRALSAKMFGILGDLGHQIVAYDEEALVRAPDHEYYRWRLSPLTVPRVAHLMAWGEDDARVLGAYPACGGAPVHITGNPRIDLMRPDLRAYYRPEVDGLRERFGDFVLVNTNFNKVNNFFAELSHLRQAAEASDPGAAHPFEVGKGRHKLALFRHFETMLPRLSQALAGWTVVLRPHPEENHAPWLDLARRCPNLRVANEGSVVPWLMASAALVANSCTTMVESAVLGVPTVNFEPLRSDEFDYHLPNSLSHSARSAAELCEIVVAMVRGEVGALDPVRRRAILDPHVAALDGPLAADRMVDVLVGAGYLEGPPPPPPLATRARGWLRNEVRTGKKRINMRRPGHKNNLRYHAHRFPEIGVPHVQARVDRLGRLLDRFGDVRVERHGAHAFRVSA